MKEGKTTYYLQQPIRWDPLHLVEQRPVLGYHFPE
jgi:hypothetical protein